MNRLLRAFAIAAALAGCTTTEQQPPVTALPSNTEQCHGAAMAMPDIMDRHELMLGCMPKTFRVRSGVAGSQFTNPTAQPS